jgi:hypothetical protein
VVEALGLFPKTNNIKKNLTLMYNRGVGRSVGKGPPPWIGFPRGKNKMGSLSNIIHKINSKQIAKC